MVATRTTRQTDAVGVGGELPRAWNISDAPIETNLPSQSPRGENGFREQAKQKLREMHPGDSIYVPRGTAHTTHNSVLSAFYNASKELGVKITTRSDKENPTMVRIWRMS